MPTLQLLKCTEGEAVGEVALRFSHYNHQGRFQRSPLMMSTDDIEAMRIALCDILELRDLLRRMVED